MHFFTKLTTTVSKLIHYIVYPPFLKKDYLKLLVDANYFTVRYWDKYAEQSDNSFPLTKYDDNKIKAILVIIRNYVKTQGIENIAVKCNLVCLDIHELLKTEYNIHSIITSGYYLLNGKKIFYAEKKNLIAQFGKSTVKLEHHVWLTIGDYIIDPTLMSSIYLTNPNYYSLQTFNDHMVIFYKYKNGTIKIEDDIYEYIPQFVGKVFYAHTQFCSKLHLVVRDQ